jgi:hypothetical protein
MTHRAPTRLISILAFAMIAHGCGSAEPPRGGAEDVPTRISDRGVQEHGKVWPRSIDSAYMGTWGDNRNSGSTLVTSFEQRRLAGQSQYLSWTEPDSPPVSALMTNGSTEAPNGLIIAALPRGGGTSTVVALDLQGKVVWRTQEWTSDDTDGDGIPDLAGQGNAVASSAGIQAPMVDDHGALYLADNYGVWKLDSDTGERIWFSRFSDYSGNELASNDLRLLNEGEDGLVGNVFASGWHIWLDRRDGSPVIVKEPDPFSAHDCPDLSTMFLAISGGEMDKSGELDDIVCLAYDANNTTPQPNNLAVRPAIPGISKHARYMFTYPGPPGKPDHARLMAYDFTWSEQEGWGLRKAWENVIHGETAASPSISPDYQVVNASDGEGNVNFISVETGETVGNPDVHFNSFGSPGVTIDGLYCDLWTVTCVSPHDGRTVRADHSVSAELAAQILPELESQGIPFLWGTTPDANLVGGAILDPSRWTFSATVGYPYFLGKILGRRIKLGSITPTAMVPVTFDATNGQMMPGQSFSAEVSRPGTSEANAMVTTTGRYVVQKAELSSLFFYYMLQGNYNFFNANETVYDDITEGELEQIREMSASLNFFGLFGPIDEEGVVPEAWKVAQPMSGLAIYEPVSFAVGARNQLENAISLVDFAQANLCLTAGCDPEEAAARLGYAAWNLDKAFARQLGEALARGEVDAADHGQLVRDAGSAATACREARARMLTVQPSLPGPEALAEANELSTQCLETLTGMAEAL